MNQIFLLARNSINAVMVEPLIVLALGCFAFCQTLHAVTPAPDGGYPGGNTAEGDSALFSRTSGLDNTALGFQTLYRETSGNYNTGIGFRALFNNTTGSYNTASGVNALITNTTGNSNTANGVNALYLNTTGAGNTAIGATALFSNTSSSGTTAIGYQALYYNTTGPGNTATGYRSLVTNITGSGNTAIGSQALQANTNNSNTAVGRLALANNTSGSGNIALGEYAGQNITTGGGNIDIGNTGVAADNGIIRLGDIQNDAFIAGLAHISPSATSIAGISTIDQGQPASAVYINTNTGQLGTVPPPSSRRFKKEIKSMDQTSEAILALKPVTFHYKSDSTKSPQFGLIAEEVAEVSPDLVMRDGNGEIYTVRYDAVNAMLLNEFLKAHKKVREMETTMTQMAAQLAEQATQIQKMNARLEEAIATPQLVTEN